MIFSLELILISLFLLSGSTGSDPESERFTAEPEDALLAKGQVHLLRCSVENLVGEVQWLRDGFGLGVGTEFEGFPRYKVLRNEHLGDYTLMINNVQLADDAFFQCQVGATAATRGLRSRTAKVTVRLPPDSLVIGNGSSSVETMVDRATHLTCSASNAKPAPNITWYSNAVLVTGDVTTTVVTLADGKRQDVTSSLTITPTKRDEGRSYECHALNDAMLTQMKTSVTIEVLYPPEISILLRPSDQLREFHSVSIACIASANPQVTEWRWFLGGELLTNEGANSSVLELSSVTRDLHRATVVCEAVNKAGRAQQSIVLDILYGPMFKPLAEDGSADPGDSIMLSCVVSSNPPAMVVWRKKGETRVLSGNATFVIPKVTENDFGLYTCTASLLNYEEISQDIRLIRKGPPVIVSPSEQSGRYGEVGIIDCVIEAIPKPTAITWLKENKVLDLSVQTRYKVREENTKEGRHSILEISDVQDVDFGTYNCTADNGYGETHRVIIFSKRAMLPLPYVLAIILSGVLIIIVVISVTVFVFRRRASLGSEKGSDGSEYGITKQKDVASDIRVEYVNSAALTMQPPCSNNADPWNVDAIDTGYFSSYRIPVPYTMLLDDSWSRHRYMPPVHSTNGHNIPAADIYGTYPRRLRLNPRYAENPNGYGTLRGGLHPQSVRSYEYASPHASPSGSRFSTNV